MSEVKIDSTPLEKIINEVLSIRNNLKEGPTEEAKLPEDIERGGIYSLVNLYAEHAAMFEILSKRLLNVKLNELDNNTIKDLLKDTPEEKVEKIKKKHIDKLKEIRGKLDNSNEEDKKIIKLIDEVLELKDIKRHIAVDRLRAKKEIDKENENEKKNEKKKKEEENLINATIKKNIYAENSKDFQGIPNSIHITDIHNDMYHFLLGMTEPIGNPPIAAFKIGDPTTKIEKIGDKEYIYPNLVYNPKFTGTITFGGDLIQSHDSGVNDNLGAIPLCLAMRNCMRQANYEIDGEVGGYKKLNPPIVYVAGNHELEALNEGQHPEVRTIMQDMFKEGLVEYCHYDKNPEPNGTFISHTKLNKKLIEVIGNDVDGYDELFNGKKPNRTLKKIESPKQREQLAKLLNENFAKTSKDIKIKNAALFDPGPEGISDFAIVGEELERTYFRGDGKCTKAREDFKEKYENENKDKNGLKKLEVLKIAALVLSKNKNKLVTSDEKKVNNFADLKEKFKNLKDKTYTATLKDSEGKKYPNNDKVKEEECKVEINQNDGTISVTKDGTAIGTFTLDELGSSFVTAITSNPNSRPYSLMNRGALLNFSGGLHGYDDKEKDYTEEALDLGCNHIVGHRPTLLDPEGRHGSREFTSLNVPIAIKMGNETTLQTDYNGKNEDKYVNCRITKFDGDGKPHLVGVSKMREEHREFFDDNDNGLNEEIKELYRNVYTDSKDESFNKNETEFVDYFKSNPPSILENNGEFKKYLKKFADKHKMDFQESKLGEALENFSSIQEYQKAFSTNKDIIIKKQNNIANKVREQSLSKQ